MQESNPFRNQKGGKGEEQSKVKSGSRGGGGSPAQAFAGCRLWYPINSVKMKA